MNILKHIGETVGEAFILVFAGTLLVRLSGKKSISELTIASTVVLFSLGGILAEPILSTSVWDTLVAMIGFLCALAVLEKLQLKWNRFERFMFGTPKVVITDGRVEEQNLMKLRLSVDDLEMRLRELGAKKIADIQTATMEANGRIAIDLKPHAKPVTMGDLERLLTDLQRALQGGTTSPSSTIGKGGSQSGGATDGKPSAMSEDGDLFEEVKRNDAGQNVPKRLH
jgi:uncharacterized membrane protein YcaP (DUF421 family)